MSCRARSVALHLRHIMAHSRGNLETESYLLSTSPPARFVRTTPNRFSHSTNKPRTCLYNTTAQVTIEVTSYYWEDYCRTISFPLSPARSLVDVFSSDEKIKTKADMYLWRNLFVGIGFQDNCNKQGFNLQHDLVYEGTWYAKLSMRLGIMFNEQDDCNSVDSYRAIGSTRRTGTGGMNHQNYAGVAGVA